MLKNFTLLVFGGALSQLIHFIFLPFITRIYGPEVFGSFSVILSISTVFIALIGLSLPIAILAEKNLETISKINDSVLKIILLLSFVIISLLIFNILIFDGKNSWFNYIIYAFFIANASTAYNVLQNNLNVKEKYNKLNNLRIFNSFFSSILKIVLGLFSATLIFMVFGHILFIIFISIYSLSKFLRKDSMLLSIDLKNYKDFVIYRTSQETLAALSQMLPIVFVGVFYGVGSAAFFSIAISILSMPANILNNTFNNLLFPKLKKLNFSNSIKLVRKIFLITLIAGCSFFILVIPYIEQFVAIFLGSDWVDAHTAITYLGFLYVFQLALKPYIVLTTLNRWQNTLLRYELISLVIKLLFFVFFYVNQYSYDGFTLSYGFLGVMLYVFLLLLLERRKLIYESTS